jgi:hypothetical protein
MKKYNENYRHCVQPSELIRVIFSISHQSCRYVSRSDQVQTQTSCTVNGDPIEHQATPTNIYTYTNTHIHMSAWLDACHNYRFALLFKLAYNRGRA